MLEIDNVHFLLSPRGWTECAHTLGPWRISRTPARRLIHWARCCKTEGVWQKPK